MTLPMLLGTLGFVGSSLAALFGLKYYRFAVNDDFRSNSDIGCSPRSCAAVLRENDAHLAGIPNFYPGLVYYLSLLLAPVLLPSAVSYMYYIALVFLTLVALGVGAYLIYSMIFKLKRYCTICLAAHAVTVCALIVLILDR